jgi:hypothetical protein
MKFGVDIKNVDPSTLIIGRAVNKDRKNNIQIRKFSKTA